VEFVLLTQRTQRTLCHWDSSLELLVGESWCLEGSPGRSVLQGAAFLLGKEEQRQEPSPFHPQVVERCLLRSGSWTRSPSCLASQADPPTKVGGNELI